MIHDELQCTEQYNSGNEHFFWPSEKTSEAAFLIAMVFGQGIVTNKGRDIEGMLWMVP